MQVIDVDSHPDTRHTLDGTEEDAPAQLGDTEKCGLWRRGSIQNRQSEGFGDSLGRSGNGWGHHAWRLMPSGFYGLISRRRRVARIGQGTSACLPRAQG
jgi:hypothetical protein